MNLFSSDYVAFLNSCDLYDLDLPLVSSSAHGGTLVMWRKELDPFITVLKTSGASVLPILFQHPDCAPSIHITIYLPTSGKEAEFIDALALLDNTIDDLKNVHPEATIFVRGDANVNPANNARCSLLKHFCRENLLHQLDFAHPTYHHFLGDGHSDSQLDVVLLADEHSEHLLTIHCKLDNPLVDSHHDVIITSFCLTFH